MPCGLHWGHSGEQEPPVPTPGAYVLVGGQIGN